MFDLSIFNKYEGSNKGKPYTGIGDDLRIIVSNLCSCMYNCDASSIKSLINIYKEYPFISDSRINGNKCDIFGNYNVSFRVIPRLYFESFSDEFFNGVDLNDSCHYITQRVLEDSKDNIYAVTSLCIKTNYMFYFHSYIYDKNEDNIIDFSKKLIMCKEQYDRLFCHREINCFNYREYKCKLNEYDKESSLYPLLYLAGIKLDEEKKHVK